MRVNNLKALNFRNIEDIEIDNESIDDVILKLYEDYEL